MQTLRHKQFASIWAGNMIGNIGTAIQVVGATWMLASMTTSPLTVAMVTVASTLPVPLFGLLGGSIADLYDRRKVLIAAQAFMLTISALLAIFTFNGLITEWMLILLTFLIGSANAFNSPAWQASVTDLLPRNEVPEGIALNNVGFNVGRTVGPAIGGLIVVAFGPAACFLVNSFSYLGFMVPLILWKKPSPASLSHGSQPLWEAIREGIQYTRYSVAGGICLRAFHFGLAGSSIWALVPVVARDLLHGDGDLYGYLLGAFGAGAIAGAILNRRLRSKMTLTALVSFSICVYGGAIIAVAFSRNDFITFVATFLCGSCWVSGVSSMNICVQMCSARWVVARALSLYQAFIYAGMATGSWLWGSIAEVATLPVAMCASAIFMLAFVPLLRMFPLPDIGSERAPLPMRGGEYLPDVTGVGPVQVTIEYRIAPAEAEGFAEALRRKRRLRLRDGARGWKMMKDLRNPSCWLEQYSCPSLEFYNRLRKRRFEDDDPIEQAVLAFQAIGIPVEVRVRSLMNDRAR